MRYSHLLWDFNGTLLDDVAVGIRSVNTLLARRGLATLQNVQQYHQVFGFPIIDYYRRLGFDFEQESYEQLAHEWVAEYQKNMRTAMLCPGVPEALELARKLSVKQLVLSATEQEMLRQQVRMLGIEKYFSEILGLSNIYAASKVELAIAWQRRERPDRVLMIGDTCHDYETAKALGAECVLIASGHQSRQTLLSCGVPVLESALEIEGIL